MQGKPQGVVRPGVPCLDGDLSGEAGEQVRGLEMRISAVVRKSLGGH